ncbi:MAG TPA: TolC family protein [Candidatus Angelobacter sp.]|jgi:multidrug efflux system outer membrane protein|nr:TolC family protein [Candidatus Angelobacter sp.]
MLQHIRHRRIAILFLSVILTGCAVGPNYKRPATNVPAAFRQPAEDTSTQSSQASATSLGDEKWWEVFQDTELQVLILTALKNNYDVRIAATRVLEAQAQLGITHADQLPTVNAGGDISSQRSARNGPIPSFQTTLGQLNLSAAWNLDFWGRYRRATEAARANLLASEWAQKAVMSTLVANVAADYFVLRQLDLQLEISKGTLTSPQGVTGVDKDAGAAWRQFIARRTPVRATRLYSSR